MILGKHLAQVAPLLPLSFPESSVWAATTKCHRLGSSNNKHFFSHSAGAWKSKIKVAAAFGFLSFRLADGHPLTL